MPMSLGSLYARCGMLPARASNICSVSLSVERWCNIGEEKTFLCWSKPTWPPLRESEPRICAIHDLASSQGYLSHKKTTLLLGPP